MLLHELMSLINSKLCTRDKNKKKIPASSRILRLVVQGRLRADWQLPLRTCWAQGITVTSSWYGGWLGACRGRITDAGGSWSSGHGVIDASAAAQLVPFSLPHTDIHTVPSTKQALSCYGVFKTSVPSVLNTSSLWLAPIPLILSWTVTPSEKAA